MLKRGVKIVWGVVGFLGIVAAMIAVVMLLWNMLLPEIFALPAISYWQAAGLMILLRLLFGGFRHGKFGGPHHRFHRHWHAHHKKAAGLHDRMHDHMHKMSFNERREFIRKCMCGEMDHFGMDNAANDQEREE